MGRRLGLALAVSLLFQGVGCSDDSGSQPSAQSEKAASGSSKAPPAPSKAPAAPATTADRPTKSSGTTQPPAPETRSESEIIEAGRGVYMGNCTACHSIDATQDGALGPAVAGSSLELLQARIVRGDYPEGYTPKRPTRVMVALPHLELKLKDLAAYLQSL